MKAEVLKSTQSSVSGFVTTLGITGINCPITGQPTVQKVLIKTPVAAEVGKHVTIDMNQFYTERYTSENEQGRSITSTWLHRKVAEA